MLCLSCKAFVNGLCAFRTGGDPECISVQRTIPFTKIRRALSVPPPCTLARVVVRIMQIAQDRECSSRYPRTYTCRTPTHESSTVPTHGAIVVTVCDAQAKMFRSNTARRGTSSAGGDFLPSFLVLFTFPLHGCLAVLVVVAWLGYAYAFEHAATLIREVLTHHRNYVRDSDMVSRQEYRRLRSTAFVCPWEA